MIRKIEIFEMNDFFKDDLSSKKLMQQVIKLVDFEKRVI